MSKYGTLSLMMLAVLLTSCAMPPKVAPALMPPEPPPYPYLQLAPTEPPAPPAKYVPTSMDPMKEVWHPGYWKYNGRQFVWIAGFFTLRPDPTASWSSDHWEERSYGWAFVPGFWF